jgi:hypothetical protein
VRKLICGAIATAIAVALPVTRDAEAAEPDASGQAAPPPADEGPEASETPLPAKTTFHLFGGLAIGKGIRFNDPYRLQTELGDSAESLSLTASYLDAYAAATLNMHGKVSQGIALHASFALDGVPQEVLTPSYVLLYRPLPRWGLVGRAGIPIVIEPDASAGFELSGGGVFYLTAALGVTADLVGDLFFGAATPDTPRTTIPIASLQFGVVYDYEVL